MRWVVCAGGNYEVSEDGRIRRRTSGRNTFQGKILKNVLMGMGYYVVNPSIGGKNVLMYVHRIVATAFLGECPDGMEVNHKDGNKLNNNVSNLEYVTHAGNMHHARHIGLMRDTVKYKKQEILSVRRMFASGESISSISLKTGISARHCRDIVKNKTRRNV